MKRHFTEALWSGVESHTVSGYRSVQVSRISLWKGQVFLRCL